MRFVENVHLDALFTHQGNAKRIHVGAPNRDIQCETQVDDSDQHVTFLLLLNLFFWVSLMRTDVPNTEGVRYEKTMWRRTKQTDMSQAEVGTVCIAWAMQRLRSEIADRSRVEESYRIIHHNARVLSAADLVTIIRTVVPRVHLYLRDHLMSIRRQVEFSGGSPEESDARVSGVAPFDPRRHIVHVPDKSHLDLAIPRDLLLNAVVRRGRGGRGVLLWWD